MNNTLYRLRSDITFTPSRSKKGLKYLVDDHTMGRVLRVGPLEYSFCSLFHRPIELMQGIERLQRMSRESPLSPSKAQKLLAWAMQSGLLEAAPCAIASKTASPAHSSREKSTSPSPRKPNASRRPFDPSFFRWKCLSSAQLHRLCAPWTFLISWPIGWCAAVLWIVAGAYAYQNFQHLQSVAVKLFVPGSQGWWLAAWFLLKIAHESGHAIACERVHVRTSGAGLGFIFLAPTPFVDVTRVWSVDNRWYRILVGGAGMLFEMTVAAIAVIVACWTTSPSLTYLCVSIASLGTLSTVAFNANPLMRYDGYYMLIDWIGRPNLWQDSNRAMKSFVKSLFYDGVGHVAGTPLLVAYGLCAWISRILVLATMGWGLYLAWDGIGLIVVLFFGCLWFVVPAWTRRRNSHASDTARAAVTLSPKKLSFAVFSLLGLLGLGFLPSPVQVVWPGIVDFADPQELRTGAPGFVTDVYAFDGQRIKQGDPVLRLENPELELEYARMQSEWDRCRESCDTLRSQRKVTELQCEESRLESLEVHTRELRSKMDSLVVRAQRDGVLIARSSQHWKGSYLEIGSPLGVIADPDRIEISASLPQSEWERISDRLGESMDVHPTSKSTLWKGQLIRTKPHTEESVESPALAAMYGGPLVVVMQTGPDGKEQMKTQQPRLATRIEIDTSTLPRAPQVGVLCSVRFSNDRETIWMMVYRLGESMLRSRLPEKGS